MYNVTITTQFEQNVPALVSRLNVHTFSDAIHFTYQIKAATSHLATPINMETLIENLEATGPHGNTYQIIADYDKREANFKQSFAGWYDPSAPHNN